MRLTIECTDEQAKLLLDCLEESFRFRMKQGNNFLDCILWERLSDIKKNSKNFDGYFDEWCDIRDRAEAKCKELLEIIYGKCTPEPPREAHEISDMWSVIRHEIYMLDHDGTDYMDVRGDTPIQLGDLPLIKVKAEK